MTEKTARQVLREKALNSRKPLSEVVEVFGDKVEARQAKMKDIIDSTSDEHKGHTLAFMMTKMLFVPGTDEPLFESGDIDALMDMPYDEHMQKISEVFSRLNGIKVTEAKKE